MTDFTYEERADYEQGFSKVYDEKIVPYLREKEAERQAIARRNKIRLGIVGAITALLALYATQLHPVAAIFPIFFGGGLGLFLYLSRFDKLQSELTRFIRPILCDFFDDVTYSDLHPGESFSLSDLRSLNLVPQADRQSIGPSFSGTWRNTAYRLTKAAFYDEDRDSDGDRRTRRLFRGIILEIACPADMPTVVFYPDYGNTMNKLFGWATRAVRPPHKLHFPDQEVEEVFEVYTDDLDAAQTLLDPAFGQKLLAFARDYQGGRKHIAAAFRGRTFYMAINLPYDFMNFDVGGDALHELNDKISAALADLRIPARIIDELLA
ncbi:DUF3137 domain-containing protein [Coralliovum pocilloporae]|uniref:DUF3137 domain-containing protein n=1 Tax=Coralliovum pocilloporae TaxID=3066369 RepID=UPI0033070637